MSVSSTVRKAGPFLGNGSASVFPFGFKVFTSADLSVLRLDTSGTLLTLALTTDYIVTLNPNQDSNPGGSITLVAGALATGYSLVVTTAIPELQNVVLQNLGAFFPDVINDALDRLTILIQQMQEQVDRSIKFPSIDPVLTSTLPAVASRKGLLLGFDPTSGDAVAVAGAVNPSSGPFLGNLVGNVTSTGVSSFGSATGAFIDKGGGVFNILAYGGNGNGIADNTAALNAANTAASVAGGIIFFPPGQYIFASRPNTFGVGVTLVGSGYGSTQQYGTFLIANYNEATSTNGFLTWDGSTQFAGTGGGIERLTIYKNTGKTGGAAVALVSTDDNHRPGFWHMSHVQINAGGTGSGAFWHYCFYLDGHLNTTSNGQGIRDITLDDCWLSGANTTDATVWLNNAAKLTMHGGEIYNGAGAASGITVTGTGAAGANTSNSTAVSILGTHISGNVVVDKASNVQIFSDITGNLTFTSNAADSLFVGYAGGTITNSSASSSTLQHTNGNNGWLVSKLASGTVSNGITGDITAARSATSGFLFLGNDGNADIGRLASDTIGVSGSSIATFRIAGGSASALEFNTDAFLARTAAGALSLGSTNGGIDGVLNLGGAKFGAAPTVVKIAKYTATLSPVAVPANSTSVQFFTVTGIASGDVVVGVMKPTAQAGLSILSWYNNGTNSLGLTFFNNTAAPITPTASELYSIVVMQ